MLEWATKTAATTADNSANVKEGECERREVLKEIISQLRLIYNMQFPYNKME
ncbi:12283_t:CDS:2, partial [Funneliformis geosporum]